MVNGLDLQTPAKSAFITEFTRVILEPRGMRHRLQFTGPTGTNAVEAAIKLARKVTGRTNIIAFTNGFHGVSAGALAATGNGYHRMAPYVPLAGVTRALFDGYLGSEVDTAAMLDQLLSDPSSGFDPPAAILLETVQGEGGLNAAGAGWLRAIARIARAHGALLIIDDIQAGCGRAGGFFSFDGLGFEPDLITLSKSLSGYGLPLSMVLIHPDHDAWAPAEHNGTFRGHNLAFVTATRALRKFWSDGEFAVDVARRARIVETCLTELAGEDPQWAVRGRGMMRGLDVGTGELASDITRRCFAAGLVIETSGPHDEVVKVLAPLTTPDDLLLEGLSTLRDACRDSRACLGLAG
jgi:diaminobutyrate-2-oxoglutarate transaminase